jgi:glucose/mannose-6-phosphate isomerase
VKVLDDALIDDADRLAAGDPGEMLRAVATSAAQVREGWRAAAEADVAQVAEDGRPRAVVVLGMGGSAIAGDVLASVAGTSCPVPISTVRSYTLPGWVGAADLVVAVSCSGRTEETLASATEAVRRGCRMLVVGEPDSPLAAIAEQGRAVFVPVRAAGRQPRAMMWALSLPLLAAGRALGLVDVSDDAVEATALRLEELATRCRPVSESFVNPAKELALQLGGCLPMLWGSSPLTGTAAYRMACQLAENAKYPSMSGQLPEPNHNQVVTWDGEFGGGGSTASGNDAGYTDDFFRDRVDESEDLRLRLVLLRDAAADEHPQVQKRIEVSTAIAQERGIAVTELRSEGESRLERLASLVGLVDFATVYLALAYGIDPTPVSAINELKARISG